MDRDRDGRECSPLQEYRDTGGREERRNIYGGGRRKAPWSKWRYLDRPNLQNLTVQMDHLKDVILDHPFGQWSNGPHLTVQNYDCGP